MRAQSSGSGVAASESQPTNRGLAAARNGGAGEPGELAQAPEQGDVAAGGAEGQVRDEQGPGPAPRGPHARLDQQLEGSSRLERGGREQVGFELGAGEVDQLEGEIRPGLEPPGQQVDGTPEGLEGLEVGMVEDVAEELGHRGIDAGDDLGFTRVLAADVRGRDLLQEVPPGTGGAGLGRAGASPIAGG